MTQDGTSCVTTSVDLQQSKMRLSQATNTARRDLPDLYWCNRLPVPSSRYYTSYLRFFGKSPLRNCTAGPFYPAKMASFFAAIDG